MGKTIIKKVLWIVIVAGICGSLAANGYFVVQKVLADIQLKAYQSGMNDANKQIADYISGEVNNKGELKITIDGKEVILKQNGTGQ